MSNAPQSVTERYVSNLLHYGRNKEFDICQIRRETTVVQEQVVGVYFNAIILRAGDLDNGTNRRMGYGATVVQAIRHALTEHGVTFR